MTLTVVIPCYNEASRGSGQTSFESRLEMLRGQLLAIDYRVILVDDGSKDNSADVFNAFVEKYNLEATWCCLRQEQNGGKGRALLKGMLGANTDYVLLLDADMSVEPYVVVSLIHGIRDNECYVATRYAPTSKIVNQRPLIRRFVSWCCQTLVGICFGLGVSDTQCGFKLLPAEQCRRVTDYVVDSWLYDVEILYNLKCDGVKIREVPVRWNNMEHETTVNAINEIIPSTKALFYLFIRKGAIKVAHWHK